MFGWCVLFGWVECEGVGGLIVLMVVVLDTWVGLVGGFWVGFGFGFGV